MLERKGVEVIAPAVGGIGMCKAGSRLVVQHAGEVKDNKLHERIVLYEVADNEYEMLMPDGDRYVEALSGYSFRAIIGQASYPVSMNGAANAFADVLNTAEIRGCAVESRNNCMAEQGRRGCAETPADNFLDWDGAVLALPAVQVSTAADVTACADQNYWGTSSAAKCNSTLMHQFWCTRRLKSAAPAVCRSRVVTYQTVMLVGIWRAIGA